MTLKNEQLQIITGGSAISGTLINALSRGFNTILDLGRTLGTAIRRIISRKYC